MESTTIHIFIRLWTVRWSGDDLAILERGFFDLVCLHLHTYLACSIPNIKWADVECIELCNNCHDRHDLIKQPHVGAHSAWAAASSLECIAAFRVRIAARLVRVLVTDF